MQPQSRHEISRLLTETKSGDQASTGRLLEVMQHELHVQAKRLMARQPPGHTLQATAVVHEAYLQLIAVDDSAVRSRSHFLALAARCMRQVLARHARDRSALKRGGAWQRVSFYEDGVGTDENKDAAYQLHVALEKLSARDAEQARIVEMRFFAGMTVAEIADELSVSVSTIEREWRMARAWIRAELAGEAAP